MKREHIFAHYEEDASRYWKLREGGYASPMSVCQGDEVTFHISNSRSYYDVFVFHEGAKRRLVKTIALSGPNTTPGRFAHPVSHVDLAPTLLDMLGLPQLARSQGRSLVKTMKSDEDAPAYAFTEFNGDINGGRKIRAVVSGRYKYVYHHQDMDQLFDLQGDPGEVNDLVGDSSLAEELALLRGALVGWMKHTGDSLPADFSSVSMRPDIPQDPGS
tara:strand:+ start:93 stop:740 length:648 start_codon:yes stop_codon:yes gene_type:complete